MKKSILFLFVCVIFLSCETNNKKESFKDSPPNKQLLVAKSFLKQANEGSDESTANIYLNLAIGICDSIIVHFPESKEAIVADSIIKTKDLIIKNIQSEFEKKKELQIRYSSNDRKAYETSLRNIFLDQGFDIKVTVKGKYNQTLLLEFVLFNDVWFRKFETSGNFDFWAKKGFTSIIISNTYDYQKTMNYK